MSEAPTTNREWRTFVARAWRGRCPRCGEGALFRARFRLAEACPACGLRFRRESGAMTGQMVLSAAVTEVFAAVLVLAVFWLTDWGPVTSIAVGLPLVVGFCYWSLPRFMALWVAVEFMTDVANREPWTQEPPPPEGGRP
jgi:uncharacterized protein (DUF983 family)